MQKINNDGNYNYNQEDDGDSPVDTTTVTSDSLESTSDTSAAKGDISNVIE